MIIFYEGKLNESQIDDHSCVISLAELLKKQRCSLLLKISTHCQSCYNSSVNTKGQSCVICLSNNIFYNCTFQTANQSRSFSTYSCENYCCSYAYQTNIYFCSPNVIPDSSSTENTSNKLATILIIVFFSIPGVICICIVVFTCLKRNDTNRDRTYHGNNQPPLSGVNLSEFNIDQVGPLYQDATQACSICLEQKCNIRTHCGHIYHSECLSAWIHKRQKCPLCVTKDFNPILLYCNRCFRSVKLCCLIDNMDQNTAIQWKEYSKLLCNICDGHLIESKIEQVSLDISDLKEQQERQNQQEQANHQMRRIPIQTIIQKKQSKGVDSADNLHSRPFPSL